MSYHATTLLRLPPELLLLILGYLTPDFFRKDVGRLTVSKRWYALAFTVLARHLRFSEESLAKFLTHKAVVEHSRPYIATVDLALGTRSLGSEVTSTPLPPNVSSWVADDVADWDSSELLKQSAVKLAAALQLCDGLRSLKVVPSANYVRRQFLDLQPLQNLLSLRQLTSLHFDTGYFPLPSSSSSGHGVHFCQAISALLPTLRQLRCRMSKMCEAALALPPPSGDDAQPLALEEVIINLSLSQISERVTAYRYTTRCGTYLDGKTLLLRERMKRRARALVARLRQPRMVRVIWHEFPGLDTHAFDAITGKMRRLPDNVEWDAAGEELADEQGEDDEGDGFDDSDSES